MVLTAHMPRLQRSLLLRLLVAVLVAVPLIVSAIYMWVLWDPTSTVKNMPVAIVNQDQGYVDETGATDAGQKVTDSLIESGALKFTQVEAKAAYAGLDANRYYFIIDIPRDFSKDLKNIAAPGSAAQMITVTFNDYNTLKASQIGGAAMEKIYQSVLKGIASTTVGGLVDGTQRLGDGLRTAAAGSAQLAAGTRALSKGITSDLAPGVKRAQDGSVQLDAGAGTLESGLKALQSGTDKLGGGATELADGIERLTSMVPLTALKATLNQVALALPGNPSVAQIAELVDGLDRMRAGSRELANQLTDPSFKYRSGLDRLVAGGSALKAGTAKLSTGMTALDAGVVQLRDGAERLNDGAHLLNAGLSNGAKLAPDFGDDEARTTLAQLIATPVTKQTNHIAQAQFGGPGGLPTILLVGSMLVPIAVLLAMRGHRFAAAGTSSGLLKFTCRRLLIVSGISLAVMSIVGVLAFITRDPIAEPADIGEVVVITALATLMNSGLLSVLFTLFGYVVGALTSVSWMMVQLFSYGGIWMLETVPTPFRLLNSISPLKYVRDGFIAAFNGVSGFGGSVLVMVGVFVLSLTALVVFALVARRGGNPRATIVSSTV